MVFGGGKFCWYGYYCVVWLSVLFVGMLGVVWFCGGCLCGDGWCCIVGGVGDVILRMGCCGGWVGCGVVGGGDVVGVVGM